MLVGGAILVQRNTFSSVQCGHCAGKTTALKVYFSRGKIHENIFGLLQFALWRKLRHIVLRGDSGFCLIVISYWHWNSRERVQIQKDWKIRRKRKKMKEKKDRIMPSFEVSQIATMILVHTTLWLGTRGGSDFLPNGGEIKELFIHTEYLSRLQSNSKVPWWQAMLCDRLYHTLIPQCSHHIHI